MEELLRHDYFNVSSSDLLAQPLTKAELWLTYTLQDMSEPVRDVAATESVSSLSSGMSSSNNDQLSSSSISQSSIYTLSNLSIDSDDDYAE